MITGIIQNIIGSNHNKGVLYCINIYNDFKQLFRDITVYVGTSDLMSLSDQAIFNTEPVKCLALKSHTSK